MVAISEIESPSTLSDSDSDSDTDMAPDSPTAPSSRQLIRSFTTVTPTKNTHSIGRALLGFFTGLFGMLAAPAFILAGLVSVFRPFYREASRPEKTAGGRFIGWLMGGIYALYLLARLPVKHAKKYSKDKHATLYRTLCEELYKAFRIKPLARYREPNPQNDAKKQWSREDGQLSLPMTGLVLLGAAVEGVLLLAPCAMGMMLGLGVRTGQAWGKRFPVMGHLVGFAFGLGLGVMTGALLFVGANMEEAWCRSRGMSCLSEREGSVFMLFIKRAWNINSQVGSLAVGALILWPFTFLVFPLSTLVAQIKASTTPGGRFLGILFAPLRGLWRAVRFHAGYVDLLLQRSDRTSKKQNPKLGRRVTLSIFRFFAEIACRPCWQENTTSMSVEPCYKFSAFDATWLAFGAFFEGVFMLPLTLAAFTIAGMKGHIHAWHSVFLPFRIVVGGLVGLVKGLGKALWFPVTNVRASWRESRRRIALLDIDEGDGPTEVIMEFYRKQRDKERCMVSYRFAKKHYRQAYSTEVEKAIVNARQHEDVDEDQRFTRKAFHNLRQETLFLWSYHKINQPQTQQEPPAFLDTVQDGPAQRLG